MRKSDDHQFDPDNTSSMEVWRSYKEKISLLECSQVSLGEYANLPEVLHLLLVGKTGSGKSSTGNTILDRTFFRECGGSESETKNISLAEVEEDGKIIKVIDTPGLFKAGLKAKFHSFHNRRLCWEIAKTTFKFREGIHLFLLIYNPTVRFTSEEEDTVKHLEEIMTERIYDYCVLVLTHSKGKFVRTSLKQYIEAEKSRGGKFAELVHAVNDRVVAVENLFQEALLVTEQRHLLLNSLAEIVYRNNGIAYSNMMFVKATELVVEEGRKRSKRFKKEGDLIKMKTRLDKYAYTLLSSLELKCTNLESLFTYLHQNVEAIIQAAEVNDIECIDIVDVIEYLQSFLNENETFINNCFELASRRAENENRLNQEIERKKNTFNMQTYVVEYVVSCINHSSKDDVTYMQKALKLPDDKWQALLKQLQQKEIGHNVTEVQNYVTGTFCQTPDFFQSCLTQSQTFIDMVEKIQGKLKEEKVKSEYISNVEKRVGKYIPEFTRKFFEDDLQKMGTVKLALHEGNDNILSDMADIFIRDYMQHANQTWMKEVCEGSFNRNRNLILGLIEVLEHTTKMTSDKTNERTSQQRKQLRLKIISNVINNRLKEYLTNKDLKQLMQIDQKLSRKEVPDDIFREILQQVHYRMEIEVEASIIYDEILTQLVDKRKIVEDLIKEANACFPETCQVSKRSGTKISLSMLKVGDEILVFDSNGNIKYEKVYLMSHASTTARAMYIQILTQKGKNLLISPGHYLPIGSLNNNVPAQVAVVGEPIFSVMCGTLTQDIITSVSYKMCKGAFCPMTMCGNIVVNDVAASCFTTFINPSWGHVLLCPVRLMYDYLPKSVFNTLLKYDPVEGMPVILTKCRAAIISLKSFLESLKKLAS